MDYGRQKIRQYHQYWTEDSLDCIKEQRNHRYLPDKNGKLTDKTTHQWSHGCDDARRYAIMGKTEAQPIETTIIYDTMRELEEDEDIEY